MNRKFLLTTLLAALSMGLVACSEKVSFDELEVQRGLANGNATFNAQAWRGQNGYMETEILARGDSTQQATCAQGDGWASIDLVDPATKKPVVRLKCSTVSANIGCVIDTDFKQRAALVQQEGTCNHALPSRIKKIAN
jgi:hypothetical protein